MRESGRLRFTPLLLALLAIEATDVIFATDSIPAVLAVSHHPFVVYSSNIFAVLGLRSLYFTLAAALERLHKLRYGLVAILAFVGLKMMLAHVLTLPIWISLAVLGSAVAITAVWSLLTEPAARPQPLLEIDEIHLPPHHARVPRGIRDCVRENPCAHERLATPFAPARRP